MVGKHDISSLNIVREYFSHNMRTSTAMVVATLMIGKCELGSGIENISEILYESAYFLDIYDKGMEICFDYVLGEPVSKELDDVYPSKVINHVHSQLPMTLEEQEVSVELNIDDFTTKSNSYIIKSLLEVILCEEVRRAKGVLKISGSGGEYLISRQPSDFERPAIFTVFTKMFAELGIKLIYDDINIWLRFNK